MSCTLLERGSSLNCSQVSSTSCSTSPKTRKRPGREIDVRDAARVEHRPLLGQVLAGRKARRVDSGLPDLPLLARPEHAPTLASMGSVARAPEAFTRPRAYVRGQGPDAADLLQRMLSNDVLAADSCEALLLTPEGARDRAAPRLAARRGRLPAADRARARRDRSARTSPGCGSPRNARSSPRSTPRRSSSAAPTGIPTADYGVPAVEVLDAGATPSRRDDELERLRILARTPALGPRDRRRRSCPPRPASTSAPSRSRRAAIPARSRSRGCTTAATSTAPCVCSSSTARPSRQADEVEPRRPRRSGASRAPSPASRSPTSGSRFRRTPRSTVAGQPARIH